MLETLGPRICIMGPSNSGKSTLAIAIARARGLRAIHLDQLQHLPDTDWTPRPHSEFAALHAAAIREDRWVIDGNYSRLLPPRLARATGLILLDIPTPLSLFRYLRRSWFERDRAGGLKGGRDSVKWDMVHHIAIVTPRNRASYARIFAETALPKVILASPAALNDFYRAHDLTR